MTITRLGSMFTISLWRLRLKVWIVRPRKPAMRHGYPIAPQGRPSRLAYKAIQRELAL